MLIGSMRWYQLQEQSILLDGFKLGCSLCGAVCCVHATAQMALLPRNQQAGHCAHP